MTHRSLRFRRFKDRVIKGLSLAAAALGLTFLAWILFEVMRRGVAAFNWRFFTDVYAPPGMGGGGVSAAIAGTLVMTALAAALAIPAGFLAGIYLSEFGARGKMADYVRFAANLLMGAPSIIIGLFVYTLIVVPSKTFSAYAGAISLAVIMFPVVARTTEDMLRLIPNELRESALALGAPRWRVTLGVVFRAAKVGLITGVLLAVARASGETAPLLFTALNNQYWTIGLREPGLGLAQPTANLTVTIFNYAMGPYAPLQRIAWGASLLIMVAVLLLTVFARLALRAGKGARR
ncbi:MAG: phosphate ABC transporter permease PstA [Planctomycetota bacterium]